MTSYPRGQTARLSATFYEYPGGPLADVTDLEVRITRVSDGVVILGPTPSGVTHIGLGTYTYVWDISPGQDLGDYLIAWLATESTAAEIVSVVNAVASTGSGPCDVWPVTWQCDLTGMSPAVTGQALQAATELLWSLSGQRFGLCTVVLRPCRKECSGMPWPSSTVWPNTYPGMTYPLPFWWNGQWLNLTCGACTTGCSCASVEEVVLPGPVAAISQVVIDGVELSASAYRVDDSRLLVRTDGGTWPLCNDLSKNDNEVGTWSVMAQFGEAVPEIGKIAVGELACEFAKALSGNDCALPQPIASLTRQGVSINYVDAQAAYDKGQLGLQFTDMFLSTYNPGGLRSRSRVYSVDGPDFRRTGTA